MAKAAKKKVLYFWIKVSCFSLLLIASAFYFGTVLHQLSLIHDFPLPPWQDYLSLIGPFLLAFSVLLLSAGLVSAIIRPIWLPIIAFALSGIALLLGWGISTVSMVLVFFYFLVSLWYIFKLKKGIDIRIKFVPTLVIRKQTFLGLILIVLTCASLFVGYSDFLKQREVTKEDIEKTTVAIQDFSLPYLIPPDTPEKQKKKAVADLKETFEKTSEELLKAAKKALPALLAAILFSVLLLVVIILRYVLYLIFLLLFKALKATNVLWIEHEKKEVEKVVI